MLTALTGLNVVKVHGDDRFHRVDMFYRIDMVDGVNTFHRIYKFQS